MVLRLLLVLSGLSAEIALSLDREGLTDRSTEAVPRSLSSISIYPDVSSHSLDENSDLFLFNWICDQVW